MLLTIDTPFLSALVMYTKKVDAITETIGAIADTQKSFLFFLACPSNRALMKVQMERRQRKETVGILTMYLVIRRKTKNAFPMAIVSQFHCNKRLKQIFVGCFFTFSSIL